MNLQNFFVLILTKIFIYISSSSVGKSANGGEHSRGVIITTNLKNKPCKYR